MRILCVIPVRGGSKGIPRKNLREIAGNRWSRGLFCRRLPPVMSWRGSMSFGVVVID